MIINKIMAADAQIKQKTPTPLLVSSPTKQIINTIVGVLTNNTNNQYIQQTIGEDTNGGEEVPQIALINVENN